MSWRCVLNPEQTLIPEGTKFCYSASGPRSDTNCAEAWLAYHNRQDPDGARAPYYRSTKYYFPTFCLIWDEDNPEWGEVAP